MGGFFSQDNPPPLEQAEGGTPPGNVVVQEPTGVDGATSSFFGRGQSPQIQAFEEEAKQAAEAAAASAEEAEDAATAAAGSAQNALNTASGIETSVAVAVASKNEAQASAALAQQAVTTTQNSAAAAATSAGQAATSATNAQNSASGAATSSSQAASSAQNAAASAGAAASSANNIQAAANTATTKAVEAATSATQAASSATAAAGSATSAASSVTASSTNASNAAASATTASTAATTATTKSEEAATSATNAAGSATAAAGSATGAAGSATTATTKASEAASSATAAAGSATTATTKASEAASSATAAAGSATNAAGSAVAADTSADQALASADAAAGSATSAGTSASNAAGSATSAAGSATTATTKAAEAAASATAANTSAGNAAGSAATATTKAAEASTSATAANSSATSASTSASTATTKAAEASTSATNAATSATAAGTSATNASNSATAAGTSATNASNSATAAAGSASNANIALAATEDARDDAYGYRDDAALAAQSAASARDATLAAFDSFDDRYLGVKTSNPTVDNDGNALVAGALYFNSTAGEMRVYTGTAWAAAYVSGAGVLLIANNLSDLASASTARTNLGLGNVENKSSATIRGEISSSNVTTALGYTPYNATNPAGYITGITSGNVTTALGYTPYNATNPAGYITGITSGNVTTALGFTPYNATNPSGYITSSGSISGNAASASYAVLTQIQDTRAAQITPNGYADFRTTFEFTNQIVGSDWHSAMTMQGWHDAYSAWQIIGPASTSAHENFYLRSGVNTTWNATRRIWHSGDSTISASGDFRAPIFYDSNNTGYYVDPAGTSNLVGLTVANTIAGSISGNAATVSSITNLTNLGRNSFSAGVVDGLTSTNFRTTMFGNAVGTWNIATSRWNNVPTAFSGLGPYGTAIAWSGADTHAFLALNYNSAGAKIGGGSSDNINWSADLLHSSNYTSYAMPSGSSATNSVDVRAPIFYDSNDTSFYVDPSVNSVIRTLYLRNGSIPVQAKFAEASQFGYSSSYRTIVLGNEYLTTISMGVDVSGNASGSFNGQGEGREVLFRNGVSFITPNAANNSYLNVMQMTDGVPNFTAYATAGGSFRAPLFYDSNDTAYFIDPNSTSRLSVANVNFLTLLNDEGLNVKGIRGQFAAGSDGQGISLFSNVDIGYPSGWGSGLGNTPSRGLSVYGGLRVAYSGGGFITSDTSVRSPIFYDSDNTGYYVDPASTSVLNNLSVGGGTVYRSNWTTRFQSTSEFVDGTLVTTDIPATAWAGDSFVIEITGKTYDQNNPPVKVVAQGYLYADTIINYSGISYAGNFASYVKVFQDGGVLKFWWPRISYWNSFNVNVMTMNEATDGTITRNRVTAIANSTEPTGTKKQQINLSRFMRGDVSATNSVDVRAPVFYDSDNTAFYINPNTTSNVSEMVSYSYRGNGNVGGTGSASWHPSGIYSAGYNWLYGGISAGGGDITSVNAVYANVYYDSGNTGYYVDPASGSSLGGATFAGLITGRNSPSTDVNSANDTGSISIRGSTTTVAAMSFHRAGAYAINMGLGTDNVFRIGGWSATSNAFQMDGSGNLTMTGNVTAYSDARLKKDVETINNALDLVGRMRGVTYTRIDTGEAGVGVIAQEMLEVMPQVVQQGIGDNDTLSVAYGNLVGVLIEAIKELQIEVETVKSRLH